MALNKSKAIFYFTEDGEEIREERDIYLFSEIIVLDTETSEVTFHLIDGEENGQPVVDFRNNHIFSFSVLTLDQDFTEKFITYLHPEMSLEHAIEVGAKLAEVQRKCKGGIK